MKKVIFVCSGNTCRSPIAEYLLKDKTTNLTIRSAGIQSLKDKPASKHAIDVCTNQNIDLSKHKSHKFKISYYYDYDLILAMSNDHLDFLLKNKPQDSTAKIKLLLDFTTGEKQQIPDPYQKDYDTYLEIYKILDCATNSLKKQLDK